MKIGDKVRVVNYNWKGEDVDPNGMVGLVVDEGSAISVRLGVSWGFSKIWRFYRDEIELIPSVNNADLWR